MNCSRKQTAVPVGRNRKLPEAAMSRNDTTC